MLESAYDWLVLNRQWVFDGFGVAILAGGFSWLISRGRRTQDPTQIQRSGENSLNIQSGRDINIGGDVKKDDRANAKER